MDLVSNVCRHVWSDWFLSNKDGPIKPWIRECSRCKSREIKDTSPGELRCAQYDELFTKIVQGQFPLLPEPEWDQDVAFVAFFIDWLRSWTNTLEEHAHCDLDPIECSHAVLQGEYDAQQEWIAWAKDIFAQLPGSFEGEPN